MENIFNGFQLINGSAEGFDVTTAATDKLTLYFIRTNAENNDGYLYFNGKKYGTGADAVSALKAEIEGKLGVLPAEFDTYIAYIDSVKATADEAKAKADTAVQSVNGVAGTEVVIDGTNVEVGEYEATTFEAVDGVTFENVSADDTITGAIKKTESNVAKMVKEVIDNEFVTSKAINEIKGAAGLTDNLTYEANAGSTYIKDATSLADADSKLDAAIKNVADAVEAMGTEGSEKDNEQDEAINKNTEAVEAIKGAAGLSENNTYIQNTGSNYIKDATSLADADTKLDAAIKAVEDKADANATAISGNTENIAKNAEDIKANADAIEAMGKSAMVEVVYENSYIKLKDAEGNVTAGFDASEFVKDGMINAVNVDTTANTITIVWNTDAGLEAVTINLADLVDVYQGDGKTVKVDGYTISAIMDVEEGVASHAAVQAIDAKVSGNTADIESLEILTSGHTATIEEHTNDISALETLTSGHTESIQQNTEAIEALNTAITIGGDDFIA